MTPRSRPPGRTELLALLALVLGWVLVNAITLTRYPLPWVDEIQFADPAVRWASGQGFTSSVWIVQAADAFWAGNAPLYTGLLCGWLWLWGTGEVAVRSLNLLLMPAVALLLWALAWRRDWVASRSGRLWLVALLLCGHGLVFSVRMARYDVLGMLLFVLAVALWTGVATPRRLLALACVAALAPAAGLALLPAAVVYIALALVLQGRAAWLRAAAVGAGLLVGAIGLMLFFRWHGVWDAFMASTRAVGVIGQGLGDKLAGLPRAWTSDKSTLLLMAAALLLPWRGPLRFAVALALLLPPLLQMAGKFPVYYGWMVFGPLAVGVCGAAAIAWRQRVAALLAAGALLVGLPLRLAGVAAHWQAFDPAPLHRHAQAWLLPQDRLVADFKTYYAVRAQGAGLFAPTALQMMRPHERAEVTALWIRPADLPRVAAALGGQWEEASPRLAAGSGEFGPWPRVMRELTEQNYPLALYRRAPLGEPGGRVVGQR